MMERLLAVDGPTQMRPCPSLGTRTCGSFLLEPESLQRIREAAFLDNGILVRK